MRAGPKRYRITINAAATTKDSFGSEIATSPTVLLTCWADIKAATSREIYALGPGFTSQVTHKITIRYPDVKPAAGMTIAYDGRSFVIQAVSDPDERKRELDIMALELTT